ncbi:hypothetical protein D9615_007116 [Tricholomella constricta]|uniref:HTH CENPB-type domain-containing protein n=1 Tax=Tricholomella constricta TaxID=117010 RepID=A0A8H5H897_9AGAR|nr:hypothetical protein D9615_007116 [Tricholomella constricta]
MRSTSGKADAVTSHIPIFGQIAGITVPPTTRRDTTHGPRSDIRSVMARNAYSELRKAQVVSQTKSQLQEEALRIRREELQNPSGKNGQPLSLRTICDNVTAAHYKESKKWIPLSHATLAKHARGGRKLSDFNAKKSWLTAGEATVLIDYALELAARSFPFSRTRLREHADEIIRAKLGESFEGVGDNWVDRFTTKHHVRLKACWSSSLDDSRARAVNPTNNDAFYNLYEHVKGGCGNPEDAVPDELVYGADETGIQSGVGGRERVFAPASASVQHQRRSGDRENITVLPTICADGTYLAPTTIFKGDGFQVKWCQENPLNSSLGYSKKGYTDGEIGVAWIKDFDEQTKAKANGRYRLLLVDGHNSHYTRGFLVYARAHRIYVVCYPSHSTHIYQGLDVVIFAVLKRYWSEERDKFERETKDKVSKTNFLRVYAAAHVRAFTPENIKAAFRKTGLIPFNRAVVTPEMMAPSLETSSQGTIPLADQQASPIRVISRLLVEHKARKRRADQAEDADQSPSKTPRTHPPMPSFPQTPSRHREPITTPSPFLRSMHTPCSQPCTPSHYAVLLAAPPSTIREEQLMNALRDAEKRIEILKDNNRILQAQTVMQHTYVGTVRAELQVREEKGNKKKSRKLNADGLPKLLSGDIFFEKVVEDDERREQEKADKAERQVVRGETSELRRKWAEEDVARKLRNAQMVEAWKKKVKEWEIERDRAKEAQQRPKWTKPTKPKAEPAKLKSWTKRGTAQAASVADAEQDEVHESEDDMESSDSDDDED